MILIAERECTHMTEDLTFKSACQHVKDECPNLSQVIDYFLNIALTAGVTTLAAPIAVASGATALTPALIILTAVGTLSNMFGVKNEIFKASETLVALFTGKRAP